MENGIYFNLPEDDYLAIERLSKSGIKRLRVSPADFWFESWLNLEPQPITPEQERARYMARLIGRAYHAARLEPERFLSTYVRELSQADFAKVEGFIATGTDMKEKLKGLGEKQTGTVAEQAERLKAAGYAGPIWQIELAAWQDALEDGQVTIPGKAYDEIVIDMERIKAVPVCQELLSGGAAEVSVLWDCPETGIPMKARFDYLKADKWVEFKTFANASGKNLNQCIMDAVKYSRYHIDAVSYFQACEIIRSGVLDVIGEASDFQIELIAQILERAAPLDCHFVFQQKGGVPNIFERQFTYFNVPMSTTANEAGAPADRVEAMRELSKQRSAVHVKAAMEIALAKRDFLAYQEIYEPGEPWLPFNPSGEITDDDFPPYWLESL